MSLLTYFGSHLSKVRPGSVRLTEVANMAEVGRGTILIEDEAGTQEVIGHKGIRLEEPDCSVVTTFRGHVGDRRYSRGVMEVGASRVIEIDVIDGNARLGFDVIRGRAWRKRPRETIDERLADLLTSGFMSGVSDHGFVGSSSIELDKGDLRGQRPGDVLNDMAVRAGFNVFVYWDESASDWGLWFQDSNTSTEWSSTLRLSNVAADVDTTTTFAAAIDTQLTRSPARVASGVWMPFKKGNVYRTRAATEDIFQARDGTAPMANVKKRSRARNIADRYLRHHSTEEDSIQVPGIFLPSDKVNLIRAGQRIEAKFSHFDPEGYADAFTWFRVLERTVTMPFGDDNDYELELVLSPQEAAVEDAGVCDVDLNEPFGTVSADHDRHEWDHVVGFPGGDGAFFEFDMFGTGVVALNDGDPDTFTTIRDGVVINSSNHFRSVIYSDLGSAHEVTRYLLTGANFLDDIVHFTVETSDDASTWTPRGGTWGTTVISGNTYAEFEFASPQTARYFSLVLDHIGVNFDGISMSEWQIIGCE